jgi:hypothetical protein
MKRPSAHEPKEKVMSAADVWNDAHQLADIMRQNLLRSEPVVNLEIPLSFFLSALDRFDQDELIILRQRVEERLAA